MVMSAKEALEYYGHLSLSFDKEFDRSKYVYKILDNDDYATANGGDASEVQKIYWEEIMQRAHWAALSSLLRNLKWVSGINSAISENNMLSFSANLRCLIESSGDTLLSLQMVSATLADNNEVISNSLKGNIRNKTLVVSKDLEESLIHFAYARKITEEEKKIQGKIPKYQNAKPASEYLKRLDNMVPNGAISDLYSILCQFSHPAAHSIHYMFKGSKMDNHYLFGYAINSDVEYIDNILLSYNNEIIRTLMLGFNSSLLTLKTLNLFDYEPTKTPIIDAVNLDDLSAWKSARSKFKN